tara:strand:- start:121 stop:555 length:435 start_codon:yes stop_codon:yes gene_type:complete
MVVLYLSMTFPVKRQLRWVDANTASLKTQMEWFSRWKADPVIEVSALETWAREHEQFKGYDWDGVSGINALNLWGIPTENRRQSVMPRLSRLQGNISERFVEKATDKQLRTFMHTMYHGLDNQREQACQQAYEIIFPSLDSTQK